MSKRQHYTEGHARLILGRLYPKVEMLYGEVGGLLKASNGSEVYRLGVKVTKEVPFAHVSRSALLGAVRHSK